MNINPDIITRTHPGFRSVDQFAIYFPMSDNRDVLLSVLGQMSRSGQAGQRLGARSGDISAAMISHRHW